MTPHRFHDPELDRIARAAAGVRAEMMASSPVYFATPRRWNAYLTGWATLTGWSGSQLDGVEYATIASVTGVSMAICPSDNTGLTAGVCKGGPNGTKIFEISAFLFTGGNTGTTGFKSSVGAGAFRMYIDSVAPTGATGPTATARHGSLAPMFVYDDYTISAKKLRTAVEFKNLVLQSGDYLYLTSNCFADMSVHVFGADA